MASLHDFAEPLEPRALTLELEHRVWTALDAAAELLRTDDATLIGDALNGTADALDEAEGIVIPALVAWLRRLLHV